MKKTIGWMTVLVFSLALVSVGCSSSKTAEKDEGEMASSEMKKGDMAEEESAEGEMAEESAEGMAEEGSDEMAEESDEGMADAGPAIDGYCPVAYKMAGKPVKGQEKFAVEHGGKTWYLANEKAMKAFQESPENFEVKYAGWCATGLAMGKQVKADPTIFSVHNEKIYLFSTQEAKEKFDAKAAEMAKKAESNWTAMHSEGGDKAAEDKGAKEGAADESGM